VKKKRKVSLAMERILRATVIIRKIVGLGIPELRRRKRKKRRRKMMGWRT